MKSPFKYVPYNILHGVCVGVCVRVCVVEIKPGMLRASLMYAFWMSGQFALQDGDFHSKKGVIQFIAVSD